MKIGQPPMLDLSLIVPCYNEESHLVESFTQVKGTLELTRLRYEIIFVDDGSQDGTRLIIEELCAHDPKLQFIFHEKNKGRGGAFKTGFKAATGRVVGFIDIDLEVSTLYVPSMVNRILNDGDDVVTGRRYYLLSQTRGYFRHVLSWTYRRICAVLLGFGIRDSETGYKFFNRETAARFVLSSENDGWFWDTEVMSRAVLGNLTIHEMPVLFLRRMDKKSTVRIIPDTIDYLKELHRFRSKIGISLTQKSPLYWTGVGYDLMIRLLYGAAYEELYSAVARHIQDDASVTDVCCGTCRLYRDHLKQKAVNYLGVDFNGHFVMSVRRRGISAIWSDIMCDPIPEADYVIMCSSFYHFHESADMVFQKMYNAARIAVILTEPVRNLSSVSLKPIAGIANRLTNPGKGDYRYRYSKSTFRTFCERHGATEFEECADGRNIVAVFNKP